MIIYLWVPKAASSIELLWPITAVSMRLISGPQIQRPVAGPVNITISFIWLHMLCFASSFFSPCLDISSSFSSSSKTSLLWLSSWLWNARTVTAKRVRWNVETEAAPERHEVGGREGAKKRRGMRWFECDELGCWWRREEWRDSDESFKAIFRSLLWFGRGNEKEPEYFLPPAPSPGFTVLNSIFIL